MGKKRVIAETGAGQHGVATATAAALFGLKCDVYMGAEDVRRQNLNVFRMKLMGANVIEVHSGSKTLKDATNEAMRDWMGSVEHTHYIIGSVVGPHPFPMIVRDFQSMIGEETRAPVCRTRRPPARLRRRLRRRRQQRRRHLRPVPRRRVREAHRRRSRRPIQRPRPARRQPLARASPASCTAACRYVLQDDDGQTADVHSCSAGLDYPGVGPEHAYWKDSGRVEYVSISDEEALEGFKLLAQSEGIIPALETAHAIAQTAKLAPKLGKDQILVINLSGRGDKDVPGGGAADGDRVGLPPGESPGRPHCPVGVAHAGGGPSSPSATPRNAPKRSSGVRSALNMPSQSPPCISA